MPKGTTTRSRAPKEMTIDEAKAQMVVLARKGWTIPDILKVVERNRSTYDRWRASDPEFRTKFDEARDEHASAVDAGFDSNVDNLRDISFAEFRSKYLHMETYPHQQQWIDVLEGREPQPMEGCDYVPGDPNQIIVNVPPGHAKSQTITVDYATYRICMDPNVRILIVSKTRDLADALLGQVKARLTSSRFPELQAAFAPEGGFRPEKGQGQFSSHIMYVAGVDKDQKDPTIQALGIRGHVYGKRADVIILDDCVDLENAADFEKQIRWLLTEVQSRMLNGTTIVVGTRLQPVDLYSELMNGSRYLDGKSPWTYLRQPMVLRFAPDPKDWVTLWPKSSTRYDAGSVLEDDGMYTIFDGPRCAKIRARVTPAVWGMVYQQQTVSDDAAFKATAVHGSVDARPAGPLIPGIVGGPMSTDGLYTIAALDPAMAGDSFFIVGKVDRVSKTRWIENAFVRTKPSPDWIRQQIKIITDTYNVNEWVIESNAFQLFLTQDSDIVSYLQTRGVKLVPFHTSKNKNDPDYGVASLSTLFGTVERSNEGAAERHLGDNLIRLPRPNTSHGIKELISQLLTWEPGIRGAKLKMDGPMALWFFETRARLIVNTLEAPDGSRPNSFATSRFAPSGVSLRQKAPLTLMRRR